MATDEHKRLANIIKTCHESLRILTTKYGAGKAWKEHVKDTKRLEEYAVAMYQLANIWEENTANDGSKAKSRIAWTVDYLIAYFFTDRIYLEKRAREQRLLESWMDYNYMHCCYLDNIPEKLKILDIGSCFNPFGKSQHFEVTAIDLHPATKDVHRGDFLKIQVQDKAEIDINTFYNDEITSLPKNYYECVIFSLLLEYIPSSQLRIECCEKAYSLLKYEGILIIITPDSQHVGKNASIMKNWRYTLGTIGYTRIRFEKLPHITCMVYRKAIDARLAKRWSELHKESYMSLGIDIPQDNNIVIKETKQ